MASDLHLEMNEYLPLRDVVFYTLRQAILRGELKPGERLMEIALSQQTGGQPYACTGGHPNAGTGRPGDHDSEKRCTGG